MTNAVIDWHSHILPKVDDGSQSLKESIYLLRILRDQNVKTVVATPHFYANDRCVDDFLERRDFSYGKLSKIISERGYKSLPKILLGSEVHYYPGISRKKDLDKLRLEGQKILLLEMPESKWTEYALREIVDIASSSEYILMIAHVDRCFSYQSKDIFDYLKDSGVHFQVNASFFNRFMTRRKALNFLKEGYTNFLGSDCHNLKSRPPMIGKACEIIQNKIGDEFLTRLYEYGNSLLL